MLVLRTGLQGHGKTLNAIKEIDQTAKQQDRPVYFHNVTGLDPSKLSARWYEFDDPLTWFELPEDAIIVVDEAQGDELKPMFGVRDPRKPVPLHVSRIELIRKRGHELHLITQDPRLIDVHARRLCNKHIHMWRIFGTSKLSRYELPRVYNEVEKFNQVKEADRTTITLDKKYFGVYSSAQAKHHFRFKPSRKAVMFAGAVVVALFLIGRAGSMFFSDHGDESQAPRENSVGSSVSDIAGSFLGNKSAPADSHMSKVEYVNARVPRVANVPSSAPVYDDLTKPVSYPKLYCASSTDPATYAREFSRMAHALVNGRQTVCQCYTQQATRVETDFDFCMGVVERGYFDPTIPDRSSQQAYQQQAVEPVAADSVAFRDQPDKPLTAVAVIPYEKGRFLW